MGFHFLLVVTSMKYLQVKLKGFIHVNVTSNTMSFSEQ